MGTGRGGGFSYEGRLYDGQHGIAGEWGHFTIDPQGEKCFCGNRGCIETKMPRDIPSTFMRDDSYAARLTTIRCAS
jgi:hypothetical protein